jgi:hypothetical protein
VLSDFLKLQILSVIKHIFFGELNFLIDSLAKCVLQLKPHPVMDHDCNYMLGNQAYDTPQEQ